MGIKIRGLEAFKALCGGGMEEQDTYQGDGLTGVVEAPKTKSSNVSILDKYTIQEKIMPLLRGIKTKEPAVMVSRHSFYVVGDTNTYCIRWQRWMSLEQLATRLILNSSPWMFFLSSGSSVSAHSSTFHRFKLT